jgi:hypothetical protein
VEGVTMGQLMAEGVEMMVEGVGGEDVDIVTAL